MEIRGFFWKINDFLTARHKKPFNIIAGRDGLLYEVRDHFMGRLVTRKRHVPELDEIKPGFEFSLPKIPGELLSQAISFFRSYCNQWEQNEVMVQIFYDKLHKCYFVECPFQYVSKTRIDAEFNPALLHSQQYVQIGHIHSHNDMEAFFSEIDNENEKALMIYGVVGRLQFRKPDMLLRVGFGGEFIQLPLEYIFENVDLESNVPYPSEWDKRVFIAG
ncbi:hypothetical protein ABEV55_18380 [Aneurinibacillus thermoaerophilus]|uniref:hypothetical protein n=1 Tax=Aneurinibacillus thermoaerophilus TaxID=143495 RepID=UPI002E2217D9|nr:hypothetical protein [Aneurinibacillus thermoaerophilus]